MIRPRLTDYHGIDVGQADVDFAIPVLDEDLPLYVDPFLLWKSPSQQDQALHGQLLAAFNHLGHSGKTKLDEAIKTLIRISECDEIGLGASAKGVGKRIGQSIARQILSLFDNIPLYSQRGLSHFEEIQLFVDGISKDRISDITSSLVKSFLIDFTIEQCNKWNIPLSLTKVQDVYDHRSHKLIEVDGVGLPLNPRSGRPLLLVPKRWLRHSPWISYDDYFKFHVPKDDAHNKVVWDRASVLSFNRENYGLIDNYIKTKELTFEDCRVDPLFRQIPVISAKRTLAVIRNLPSGNKDSADKKYEDAVVSLLASMFYPQLDYAADQVRTDSGAQIRDLIFYLNRGVDFLKDIHSDYGSRQLVFEMKNVHRIDRDHISQLNRYLNDQFGRFGVLVTRHPLPRAMRTNTIDLWSGQRRCIIPITDEDLSLMVDLFEERKRPPIDVLRRSYIQFQRECPS